MNSLRTLGTTGAWMALAVAACARPEPALDASVHPSVDAARLDVPNTVDTGELDLPNPDADTPSADADAPADAGTGGDADSDAASVLDASSTRTIHADRSLLVIEQRALTTVATELPLGAQLYAINQFLMAIRPAWNVAHPEDPIAEHADRAFALAAFRVAAGDTDAHNAHPGRQLGSVRSIRNTYSDEILPSFDPDRDPHGPFELLAVVNRMDLTGDFDARGGGVLAGGERRWFGEGRLVYGLRSMDGSTLRWILIAEYRLPALRRTPVGVEVDPAFDFAIGPTTMADWIAGRQVWAEQWAALSEHELASADYQRGLADLVGLFARGQNHVSLRSAEQVRDSTGRTTDEFEYREYYLNGQWMLSTRKVRREPFGCADASRTLADRIDAEWSVSDGELSWAYTLGERNLDRDEVEDLTRVCGELPYGASADGRAGVQLRAKFARFEPAFTWSVPTLPEERRHGFAMGTCSGCHARETGTRGFHIGPAADGTNATLSPFLQGPTTVTLPSGAIYTYDEMSRRDAFLRGFLAGTDLPGPMLHHIEVRRLMEP